MSLDRFIGSRLVVQSPSTTLYDAARAMLDNRIGTVLVHDETALVGIVTDRDLGLDTAIDDLDVYECELAEIMSKPVASVPIDGTLEDVTSAMIERRVRRIPLLEGASIAGLVTFDDLVLERAAAPATLAAILSAQLSQPSRLKPEGELRPTHPTPAREAALRADRRHEMHQRQAYARLVRRTLEYTDLGGARIAGDVLRIVLDGVLRGVTPGQAARLLAQLPSTLRQPPSVRRPSAAPDPVGRESIERQLQQRLSVDRARAQQLLDQIGRALGASISSGERTALDHQLANDMRGIIAP